MKIKTKGIFFRSKTWSCERVIRSSGFISVVRLQFAPHQLSNSFRRHGLQQRFRMLLHSCLKWTSTRNYRGNMLIRYIVSFFYPRTLRFLNSEWPRTFSVSRIQPLSTYSLNRLAFRWRSLPPTKGTHRLKLRFSIDFNIVERENGAVIYREGVQMRPQIYQIGSDYLERRTGWIFVAQMRHGHCWNVYNTKPFHSEFIATRCRGLLCILELFRERDEPSRNLF